MNSDGGSQTAPLNNQQQIQQLISELQDSLRSNIPGYERILFTLHKNLQTDEELCHLLSDEQVGVLCAALQKKTGVVIAETTSKKKTASGKSLKDITLDEI